MARAITMRAYAVQLYLSVKSLKFGIDIISPLSIKKPLEQALQLIR